MKLNRYMPEISWTKYINFSRKKKNQRHLIYVVEKLKNIEKLISQIVIYLKICNAQGSPLKNFLLQ
jgi:hypothetical protein